MLGRHFVLIFNYGISKQVPQSTHTVGWLAKWLAVLQEFNFSLKIIKGGCSKLKNALIHLVGFKYGRTENLDIMKSK